MIRVRTFLLSVFALIWCCAPAFAQLRGHWRLQETTGTTAVDTSPLSNNGTYTNSPALASSTPVPSDGAIAARFDGSNDYVAIPNEANYDLTGPMAVCCWIKVDAFNQPHQAIVTKGNNAWQLAREVNTNFVQFTCNGLSSNTEVVSTTSVNDGQWHHVAGVYTGSQLRIYIDGQLNNSVNATGSISTNNNAVEIARNSQTGNRNFNGAIYNVVIYNGALDAASIQALYNWDALCGNWKLNQTSGTTATDSSTSANHGTYTNGPTLAAAGPYPGAGDKAANFDGSNDYVAISNEHYYDLSGPMSVATWVCVDTFTKQWQAIVTKGDSAWRLTQNDNNDTVRFTCNGLSTTSVSSNTSVNDGAWHHVVGVYTGSQLRIYIDGVLDNFVSATGVISRNNQNVQLARNAEVTGKEFDGRIHDVRVYSVALSASQVAELYGLVGRWRLNQTSGTTAVDSSVFGSNGTVSGPANWSTRCNGTRAFDFNGSTNYVSISNASQLQPTKALTIAGWVRGDAWGTGTEVDIVLRKGEDNPNNWQLAISDGRVELLLDENDTAGFRGNTVLSTGVWYHVAAAWDGSNVRIYVNGQLDNTPAARSGTIGTDTRPVYLGGRSGTDLFDGMLQDVRLYNRALTQAEIAQLAGLIAHWKLTETSGTAAVDSSLVANNGTYLNGVALNGVGPYPGVGAVAATFDGVNDYVAVPNESLYDISEQITIAGWFKVGVFDKTWQAIIAKGDSAWRLSRNANTNTLHFACTGVSPDQVNGSIDVNDGKWHHVACVYNGTTMSLYVDGVLDASVNASGSISSNNYAVWIGANEQMLGRNFNGSLHDMRVYNRALCPAEIVDLYGLIAHWKLDEAGGTTAWDSVGGNNGTYQNNVTTGAGGLPLYSGNTAAQFGGGNNDRIQVPAFDVAGSGITILAWFKPSSLGDYRFVSKATGTNTADHLWALGINGSTQMRALVRINGTTRQLTPTVGTLTAGTWYLAALTFDGTTMRVFLNGSQVGSGSWSGSVSTSSSVAVALGNQPSGAGNRAFPGVLDDVRIYNRPLWPSDIQAFYDAASGGSTPGVRIIRWVEIQ